MIWNGVELFNVSELCELADGGVQPYRFPSAVREVFDDGEHPYAVTVGQMTTGCELRFVSEGADVTLEAVDADGSVEIMRGNILQRVVRLSAGVPQIIELRPDAAVDEYTPSSVFGAFNTCVWRVVFGHDCHIAIRAIKPLGDIRPPRACEIPAKKIIAYGSSITHSAGAGAYTNSYVYTLGRWLGADMLCKGMGGSCYIQRRVADYVAGEEWDAALLELGINMVSEFPVEVFRERATYIIEKVLERGKPVLLISNFTSFYEFPSSNRKEKNDAYVACLEEIYEELKCDNLIYVRGRDIVTDFSYLTADLLHPSPYGHGEMGRKLAAIFEDKI